MSDTFRDALEEAIELIEGYVDVKDSDSGPVANNAMRAVQILNDAMEIRNQRESSQRRLNKSSAIDLIHDLVSAEVRVMKELDSVRGISKTAERLEESAACVLFKALTGEVATPEQTKKMLDI